ASAARRRSASSGESAGSAGDRASAGVVGWLRVVARFFAIVRARGGRPTSALTRPAASSLLALACPGRPARVPTARRLVSHALLLAAHRRGGGSRTAAGVVATCRRKLRAIGLAARPAHTRS